MKMRQDMSERCEHGGRRRPGAARRDRGTVLIVTMWIVLALAGLVLTLAQAVRVEGRCSANGVAAAQAAAAERGAIQYVMAHVDALSGKVPSEETVPCEGVRIGEGAFWILRPSSEGDGRTYAFGIRDEASKLNVNTATDGMLSMLPDMTTELAASIIDWRDGDSNVTQGGAESEYYLLQEDPYECKNAPLETVDELLLVKEMSREVLLGEDANRNGFLDDNENDGSAIEPPDNGDGQLGRGIHDFVTVYSSEPNTSASGDPRIDVNQSQGPELSDLLREAVPEGRLEAVLGDVRRGRPFQNVLDFYFRTGLTMEEFQQIADRITTDSAAKLTGLVNVNTAPREVLACLPGLGEGEVSALLSWRAESSRDLSTIAWVAEALPRDKAVALGRVITARSYQFSADIVAVSGDGRAFRRCRVVVDAASSPPQVVYWQDLTHLGWPLEAEIVARLRSGEALDQIVQKPQPGVR